MNMQQYNAPETDLPTHKDGHDSRLQNSMLVKNKWLVDTFICHRGFHSGNSSCPENSMKAFERAVQGGFAVELEGIVAEFRNTFHACIHVFTIVNQ